MPYSHHSHSGQFCAHAKNTLEEMIQEAISKGFHTFSLTEHIPRHIEDFYPEEELAYTEASLAKLFDDFTGEAARLRDEYSPKINIFIGFETEWIRPLSLTLIQEILAKHTFDFFMGSVHHVHTVPIDFDKAAYERARAKAGGTDERLFEDYFDSQYEMLQALEPPVVGHFDLIRLLSDEPDAEFNGFNGVWERIHRNLEYITSYGGILELNSSALRKGLAQPYPCLPICEAFQRMGGRFTISDDSHSTDQVGTNYFRLLDFVQKARVKHIWYADRNAPRKDNRFPNAGFSSIAVSELAQLPFWTANQ
ncbi:histidinol phosphate phosphatase H [Lindgomyces ingoldianus]|uniref:Histidinol phosphate phosphatase H n=1 Tax=Lindgomyces ingoldianus TaxID=673940 RepID=A0ACB6R9B4_9PLEO|nr:histidinol phosphate phosphatase H [Lindgomyces ingoldianus]KAF2475635.1 histidinol phosphate phosphatase H [Lindgomyces ingoldianus]